MADQTLPQLFIANPVSIDPGDLSYIVENTGTTPAQGAFKFSQLMFNRYRLLPSVASSNLTLALVHEDGTNPSADRPLYFKIGNSLRAVTAALSVTKNAGTNWCNSGSAELAAQEIDYFVYIGYNATDGVTLGFSRMPLIVARYDSFSTTTTNEKYCAISTITNAAGTDTYINIGRFAATLGVSATYYWSVPTFDAENLINAPVINTRWLNWQPAYSASGSMTYTGVTTALARYAILYKTCEAFTRNSGTTGGTASSQILCTLPFSALQVGAIPVGWGQANDGTAVAARVIITSGTPNLLSVAKYDASNWALAAGKVITAQVRYEI